MEAELTEVEWPGVGPRPPHDDEVGDFYAQEWILPSWARFRAQSHPYPVPFTLLLTSWPGQAAVVQGEAVVTSP